MELEAEWENPEPQTELINGREIITNESVLMCKAKGGMIEAVTSGQEQGFSFQRALTLSEEMEEKYPGLFDQLIDPHGSLYLEEGMYEKAIQFLEDYLGERNGEVLLAPLYDMKDPKDLFVVAVLDRLLTDCDGSSFDRIINGLENTGFQTGMDQKEGWDIHKLNQQMIEMLRIDCKATSEKMNTSSFARWTEEHKKFVSILGDAVLNLAYAVMIWRCTTASTVTRASRSEGGSNTIITPEMEEKILFGQRKNPAKNELIGGHSPNINNSNPNYAVEVLQANPDGTQKVKFVTQFADGNLSNIKTSTLFPEGWSSDKIINSIKTVGDSSPIGVRASDGAMLYRDIIDGVQIEVIKIGDTVTSGYPTGGIKTGLLPGFSTLE